MENRFTSAYLRLKTWWVTRSKNLKTYQPCIAALPTFTERHQNVDCYQWSHLSILYTLSLIVFNGGFYIWISIVAHVVENVSMWTNKSSLPLRQCYWKSKSRQKNNKEWVSFFAAVKGRHLSIYLGLILKVSRIIIEEQTGFQTRINLMRKLCLST